MTEEGTLKSKTAPAKPAAMRGIAATKPVAVAAKKSKRSKKDGDKAGIKVKVVRDSFTMPQSDYAKIADLKQVCLKAGLHVKKSELLRAGLHALEKLSATQLKQAITRIEQIKTGRPRKEDA